MEFSDEQKLIITLLTDIHAKLEIEDSVDPLFVQRMVNENQAWALEWAYPGLFESADTPGYVRFVADVLDMWETLERSFSELSVEEKQRLAELAPVFGERVEFQGFDGNKEFRERSVAKILINDLDRWEIFKGRSLNSHMGSIDAYTRMLEVYGQLPDEAKYDRQLSPEELAEVMNERVHPGNR